MSNSDKDDGNEFTLILKEDNGTVIYDFGKAEGSRDLENLVDNDNDDDDGKL